MKRSELKGIIKECLIEILEEGVTSAGQRVREARTRRQEELNEDEQQPRRRVQQRQDTARSLIESPMIKTVAGKNDVLAGILAQTATTTLRDQAGAPDPERVRESFSAMGSNPASFADDQAFYSPPVQRQNASPMNSSAWDALAFGRSNGSSLSGIMPRIAPPPPELRKLSDAELDRKVG